MAKLTLSRRIPLLRRALLSEAVLTGATGSLMFLGAGPLADILALPAGMLRNAGLVLLPFVACIAYLATRERMPRAGIWAVILINELWVAASIVLLLRGWVAPNGLGVTFVLFQALVVAVFATAQYIGVRDAGSAAQGRSFDRMTDGLTPRSRNAEWAPAIMIERLIRI